MESLDVKKLLVGHDEDISRSIRAVKRLLVGGQDILQRFTVQGMPFVALVVFSDRLSGRAILSCEVDGTPEPPRLAVVACTRLLASKALAYTSNSPTGIAPPRYATIAGAGRFADAALAAQTGAKYLVAVAAKPSSDASVVCMLAFKNKTVAVDPAAARFAEGLAHSATTHPDCRGMVEDTINLISSLCEAPRVPPFVYNAPSDIDDDMKLSPVLETEASSSDDSQSDHAKDFTMQRWTLCFRDREVERRFARWHNASMARVDFVAYILNIGILLMLHFAPFGSFQIYSKAASLGINPWRSIAWLLPFFLSIFRKRLYVRRREAAIAYVYVCTLQWTMHVQNYSSIMSEASWKHPLFFHGFSWSGVLCYLFNVRWVLAFPFVLCSFTANAFVLTDVCADHYPNYPLNTCLLVITVPALAFTLASLAVFYIVERRTRKTFLLSYNVVIAQAADRFSKIILIIMVFLISRSFLS